jgi:uncharacterized membrane protein/nitrite reductase/ring-hydroxylating ferredoxin subunit
MRSIANIKGHPIHPILVTFPIAFFIGTFFCDVMVITNENMLFHGIAKYLEMAGIVTALLAALPGSLDYFNTVPPDSSAKKRATQHGLLNITLLLVFTFALLLRRNPEVDFLYVLLLEGAGVIILSVSGWLGGTLVYRNQIGVDHRYAEAGKWQEEKIEESTNVFELHYLHKLKVNQMKLMHLNGKRIVIGRTETGFSAFEDSCTHRGGTLADGVMICGTVQCPWHGSQFDVNTGQVNAGPAKEKIKTFRIETVEDKYYLHL